MQVLRTVCTSVMIVAGLQFTHVVASSAGATGSSSLHHEPAGLEIASFLFSPALASETGEPSHFTRGGSEVLVSNLPQPRDQGELAFCYAAVPAVLLDRHRCQKLGLDCNQLPPSERVSMLDLAAMHDSKEPGLHEYGSIMRVLIGAGTRMTKRGLDVSSEACLPYSTLARQDMPDQPGKQHLRAGWSFLYTLYNDLKEVNKSNCNGCTANSIYDHFPLRTPVDQIAELFENTRAGRTSTFPSFVYQIVAPPSCLREENRIAVPSFRLNAWPQNPGDANPESIHEVIEQLLRKNVAVSLSYCSRWEIRDANQQCLNEAGHASIIVGMRDSCSRDTGQCERLYKLLNSYGADWNKQEFIIWVQARHLIAAALELKSPRYILVWVD